MYVETCSESSLVGTSINALVVCLLWSSSSKPCDSVNSEIAYNEVSDTYTFRA